MGVAAAGSPDAFLVLWYFPRVRFAIPCLPLVVLALAGLSCASESSDGDPSAAKGVPAPGGKDLSIRQISDPTLPNHARYIKQTQPVSGALVIAVDTYDETHNGKSIGTIFVQDIGSVAPYSGISLFAPAFNPGNLRVSAGDVLDLRGQYQETTAIATVTFAKGALLPQISTPVATFRYETHVPEPVDIDVNDLTDFAKGRRWLGMLVRVKDVTLKNDGVADANGRVAVSLHDPFPGGGTRCDSPFPKPATVVNSLFALDTLNLTATSKVKSVVGVVSFFCGIQLAPRSAADIQL